MDLIAGRYRAQPASGAGPVRNPARDTVSGGLVTVLRRPAPADALVRARELERLRRCAGTRRPHLADVRAVELSGNEIHVVCEPVAGVPLDPGSPPSGLTVGSLRRIATELLDALAALHLAGVAHGSVRPDAVLLSTEPGAPRMTLLPLPLTWPAAPSPTSADDDRCDAATLLLGLLRRVPAHGSGEEALARDLAGALARVGGIGEEPRGPRGSAPSPATAPPRALPPPLPLALSPQSLAPLPAAAPGDRPAARVAPPSRRPAKARPGRRPSRRTVLEVSGAALALAALIAAVVTAMALGGGPDSGRKQAASPTTRPAVTTPASPSPSVPTAASGSPAPSAWDLPTTVPALIDALSARPDAAGPSGPALLDTLRGLASGDAGVVQQSALRLMSLVLDDPGVDPRYAAAGLAAFATGPVPGPPGAPPSCFGVVPSAPDPVAQQYARRVLDRLAAWQAGGLPADRADRLRELAAPVAAAEGTPTLGPCPAG